MEEVTDSRAAAFSLKRSHNNASHPANIGGSSASTPRKRARRIDKLNTLDAREMVPLGGSFSVDAAILDHDHHAAGDQDDSNSDLVPSMNWNTGTKARIRVSLRDRLGSGTTSHQEASQQLSTRGDVKYTEMPLKEESIKQEDDNQADLSLHEGRRLYVGNMAYATNEAALADVFKEYSVESLRIPVNPRTARSVGYAFVDLSSSDEASWAVQQLSGMTVDERQISVQLAKHNHGKKASRQGSRDSQKGPKSDQELKKGSGKEFAAEQSTDDALVFSGSNNIEIEPTPPSNRLEAREAYEEDHSDTVRPPQSRKSPVRQNISDPESEGGVLVNILDDSEYESGEITPSSHSPGDLVRYTEERTRALDGADTDDELDSEVDHDSVGENDAMMDYADAEASTGTSKRRCPPTIPTPSSKPQALAELDQRDIGFQLRYFYVGKAPHEVDLSEPVRCLVCNEKGHMAAE
ncbi:MAG: hypothetical protein Q9170_008186, partial [Blastenia crenularia]